MSESQVEPQGIPFTLLLNSLSILLHEFASVTEHLYSFHQRVKDRFDFGAIVRVFKPKEQVRIMFRSRQNGNYKVISKWSSHEVLQIRGVVVTVRELSTGREYKTHHDRLQTTICRIKG